jgi:hypothetical protein
MNEIELKTHCQLMATKDHIQQQFKKDLSELLLKYKAHLYAGDLVAGIYVAIDGTYDQRGETLTPQVEFDLGDHVG